MNHETAEAITKHIDHNDRGETIFAHHLGMNNVNDSLYLPTLTWHMNKYKVRDHEASKREVHCRHQMRKRKLADNKTGHKAIKAALDTKPVKPLTALTRDIQGPQGQPKGSTTCDPQEVDAIARRAWGAVYEGNVHNHNTTIHNFCRNYANYIFTANQFDVQPLDGPTFKLACHTAKHSVAGLDHFTPQDLTYLSDDTYAWIATMLNLIEQGAPWPRDLLRGKAAYLSKDSEKTEDPLAYRVLLILPAVYRRWAAARLHTLKPWIRTWQLDNMYAGVEGVGADDAWWETSLTIEYNRVTNANRMWDDFVEHRCNIRNR